MLFIEKSAADTSAASTLNLSQINLEPAIYEDPNKNNNNDLSSKINENESQYWQPKLVLNIRKEKDYKVYAEIARKILLDRKEKCITLTSCGIAIVNLLKVSSALSHFIPGLHKVSRFVQSKCKTCEFRA